MVKGGRSQKSCPTSEEVHGHKQSPRGTEEPSRPQWLILLPPLTSIKCEQLPLDRIVVNTSSTVPGTQYLSNYCHSLHSSLEPNDQEKHTHAKQSIKSFSAQSNGPRSPRKVGTEREEWDRWKGGGLHQQNVSSSLHWIGAELGAMVCSTLNPLPHTGHSSNYSISLFHSSSFLPSGRLSQWDSRPNLWKQKTCTGTFHHPGVEGGYTNSNFNTLKNKTKKKNTITHLCTDFYIWTEMLAMDLFKPHKCGASF